MLLDLRNEFHDVGFIVLRQFMGFEVQFGAVQHLCKIEYRFIYIVAQCSITIRCTAGRNLVHYGAKYQISKFARVVDLYINPTAWSVWISETCPDYKYVVGHR